MGRRPSKLIVKKLLTDIAKIDAREAAIKRGEIVVTRPTAQNGMPPVGWVPCVCVDVDDQGLVETPWGVRHRVEFVWELGGDRREDGKRFLVWRSFTASLGDGSNLRRFLEVWQGYPFGPDELKDGVPLAQRFVGRDGMVLLEPRTNPVTGKVYRNVIAATPLPASRVPVKPDGTYIRKTWRRKKAGANDGEPEGTAGDLGSGADRADGRGDRLLDGAVAGHGAPAADGALHAGDGGRGESDAADAPRAEGPGLGAEPERRPRPLVRVR